MILWSLFLGGLRYGTSWYEAIAEVWGQTVC